MITIYCDRCKKNIGQYMWKAHILYKQWADDDKPKDIAEICDKCLDELQKWLGKPHKQAIWASGEGTSQQ